MAIKKKKKSRKDEEDIPLVVYTTYIGAVPQALSHCKWLEQMFKSLNVRYKKVDLGVHKDMVTFVRQTSGKRELPQVFINNIYIGGYEEFFDWHEDGNVYYVLKEMGYTDPIPEEFDKSKEQIDQEAEEYVKNNEGVFQDIKEKAKKMESDMEHLQAVRRKWLFQRKQKLYENLAESEANKQDTSKDAIETNVNVKDMIKRLNSKASSAQSNTVQSNTVALKKNTTEKKSFDTIPLPQDETTTNTENDDHQDDIPLPDDN
ncbi:hypothetical protein FDP41_002159 [Naegleria fowleri]|uniref:Glutaredoxin domain-containing protein n=1 Tax=Naegleria fowleri TaxID=5763 RepID=A0A6A5C1K0_NAEFO|nr:uncharacterized protein FDP41_002159 [Naegleria fowleri]KAF0979089.1 hypothetical protein FDP41_002159 [Naegleria fowleri]